MATTLPGGGAPAPAPNQLADMMAYEAAMVRKQQLHDLVKALIDKRVTYDTPLSINALIKQLVNDALTFQAEIDLRAPAPRIP